MSTPVTSLAEVWIEIKAYESAGTNVKKVTSLAEVWIEIYQKQKLPEPAYSHFPRGSVD